MVCPRGRIDKRIKFNNPQISEPLNERLMKAWEKVAQEGENNKNKLIREMHQTVSEIESFVQVIEEEAKIRKFRRKTYGNGEWVSYKMKEKEFVDALKFGKELIDKLLRAISPRENPLLRGPQDVDSQNPVKDIGAVSEKLVERFARILEDEGISHNYPVAPIIRKQKTFRKISIRDKIWSDKLMSSLKAYGSRNTLPRKTSEDRLNVSSHSLESGLLSSPEAFLREYARRENLDLEFKEISAVKNTWIQEYIYSCRLHNITTDGYGKRRNISKQDSAAQMLRIIINRQKRDSLPPEMTPLTEAEITTALLASCELIEYGDILRQVCSEENARYPIYSPAHQPDHPVAIRCKALGYNAVGFGRNKDIARRMSAKMVLDQIMQERMRECRAKTPTTVSSRDDRF